MFVYVMDLDSKQYLEELGYTLIREDPRNNVWCFENKYGHDMSFSLEVPCVFSDIVLF